MFKSVLIVVILMTFATNSEAVELPYEQIITNEECNGLEGFDTVNEYIMFLESTGDTANKAEKMSDYQVEEACDEKGNSLTLTEADFKHCKDGSVSFEQPDSTGINGYNGYCGETSASNMLYIYCSQIAAPKGYCNQYTSDITPGTKPSSLKDGLNKMFEIDKKDCPKGKWEYYEGAKSPEEYIDYLVVGLKNKTGLMRKREDGSKIKRSPFPVLIEAPPPGSKGLHWVTVVDVVGYKDGETLNDQEDKCSVIVNTWGKQYKVPCHRMANWAKNSSSGVASTIINPYSRVKFIEE